MKPNIYQVEVEHTPQVPSTNCFYGHSIIKLISPSGEVALRLSVETLWRDFSSKTTDMSYYTTAYVLVTPPAHKQVVDHWSYGFCTIDFIQAEHLHICAGLQADLQCKEPRLMEAIKRRISREYRQV